MPKVPNPRKVFNFRIEVAGIAQFLIQKVTLPEIEIAATEHGETNVKIKTAGMITVGDLVVTKIKPADSIEPWAYDWFKQAQDMVTGGGQLSEVYKRDIILRELGVDGISTIASHIMEGCWIKKTSHSDFDRVGSDNIMETVTFSVDRCYRVNT